MIRNSSSQGGAVGAETPFFEPSQAERGNGVNCYMREDGEAKLGFQGERSGKMEQGMENGGVMGVPGNHVG